MPIMATHLVLKSPAEEFVSCCRPRMFGCNKPRRVVEVANMCYVAKTYTLEKEGGRMSHMELVCNWIFLRFNCG